MLVMTVNALGLNNLGTSYPLIRFLFYSTFWCAVLVLGLHYLPPPKIGGNEKSHNESILRKFCVAP